MNAQFLSTFKNPGSAYRGKPFWAWNGRLEPGELLRQIRVVHQMGLGGFFMHARAGLATPYLSDEWFDAVHACLAEANARAMEAWLYDEDRWPSGAAGGLVTKHPKYRMQHATVDIVTHPRDVPAEGTRVAAFTVRIDGAVLSHARRVDVRRLPRPDAGESLIVFRVEPEACSDWFNGYTYLDTMNREDEPHHGKVLAPSPWDGNKPTIPWTRGLPAMFTQRYGYDVLAHLHEIVCDVAGVRSRRPRYDYHACITALLVDAFARQIGEWCDRHNVQHLAMSSVVHNPARFHASTHGHPKCC